MRKGHSNAHVDRTAPYPTNPGKACIPIEGGASPYTVKDLPSLALDREEWATIGRKMGWRPEVYILIEGGVEDITADLPVSIFVLDRGPNAETTTEEWSVGDSAGFEQMRKAWKKASESELIEA